MDPDDDSATIFLDQFGLGRDLDRFPRREATGVAVGGEVHLGASDELDDDLDFPEQDTDVLFDELGLAADPADEPLDDDGYD